jgi:hypothetical protein
MCKCADEQIKCADEQIKDDHLIMSCKILPIKLFAHSVLSLRLNTAPAHSGNRST